VPAPPGPCPSFPSSASVVWFGREVDPPGRVVLPPGCAVDPPGRGALSPRPGGGGAGPGGGPGAAPLFRMGSIMILGED